MGCDTPRYLPFEWQVSVRTNSWWRWGTPGRMDERCWLCKPPNKQHFARSNLRYIHCSRHSGAIAFILEATDPGQSCTHFSARYHSLQRWFDLLHCCVSYNRFSCKLIMTNYFSKSVGEHHCCSFRSDWYRSIMECDLQHSVCRHHHSKLTCFNSNPPRT